MDAILLPEPKSVRRDNGHSRPFKTLDFAVQNEGPLTGAEVAELVQLRFWDYPELVGAGASDSFPVILHAGLPEQDVEHPELFSAQGYVLTVRFEKAEIWYDTRDGLVNAVTSVKTLISKESAQSGFTAEAYTLPLSEIVDYPSVPARAVAATFSWYAGYGRIGFDMQLWGYEEWVQYLNHLLDFKLNQINMVMYGYWPFEFPEYPETVFDNVPLEIWNAENERFLKVKYSHPNVEDNFLPQFLELAHKLGVKVLAYVGLNSYNGARSIVMPEKRMKAPEGSGFLNDFDSLCLSDADNVKYIVDSMRRITELGFDGFTLEESEEGFWFCTCSACTSRWYANGETPGEAKHAANLWLLDQIYAAVREVNQDAIIGIRAFRQPPLEKDPQFLAEIAASIPSDVVLFWAPALYVPPTEFPKWVDAFGKERIWGRDSESNSITSTMGRLYRTFESNLLRYEDEPNAQTIERDIEMHISSVEAGVHGINGYMFEWYGLFMHQWAHGNYGWGSQMDPEQFYRQACHQTFGGFLGDRVLHVLKSILTIHESQMPFFTTPFPFQSNKIMEQDLPRILQAAVDHEGLLELTKQLEKTSRTEPKLNTWALHFARLVNAQRRNKVIYEMALTSLAYEKEADPQKRKALLRRLLELNEEDFSIAKEMFFDLNPVAETGVKSSMMPYHETKRLINNLLHPEAADPSVICSGIEALGWLWLADETEEGGSDE